MPDNPEERASVRSWMAFADDYFFPSIYRVRTGVQRGYSEDEIQEATDKWTMRSRVWSINWRARSVWWRVHVGGHRTRR
jgi:hypothetical protein